MAKKKSFVNQIHESGDFFSVLADAIEQRYTGPVEQIPPITDWICNLFVDGRPFSLANHEYQRDIFNSNVQRQVFLKGAQLGITTIIMLTHLYKMITRQFEQGCLYLFPTQLDVQDFSRGRLNPVIVDNECISKFVENDAQETKRIGRAMFYLRGAKSTAKVEGLKETSSQLKSIPVDAVVFDEADEMSPAMIDLALERMSHSKVQKETYLSTPTIPDWGVDKLFKQSDQRYWYLRCSKCNGETCLELTFPDCLHIRPDKTVIRLCQKCRDRELDPQIGRWIPLYPNVEFTGWRISQLNSAYVDPGTILYKYLDPPMGNIGEIYNSKLAQAYVSAENRLTKAQVLALCTDRPMAENDPGPCYMGIDPGHTIHCVIGKRSPHRAGDIIFIGELKTFEELYGLIKRFNVTRAVIDELPETHEIRKLCRAFPGKMYRCHYSETHLDQYKWNDAEQRVVVNRTESLDASHHEIDREMITLPKLSPLLETFAYHCQNISRVLKHDVETNSKIFRYLSTGADHYRHAFNYECIARNYNMGGIFDGCVYD